MNAVQQTLVHGVLFMMIPEASRSREDPIDDEGKIFILIFIQNLGNGNKAQTKEDAYTCVG